MYRAIVDVSWCDMTTWDRFVSSRLFRLSYLKVNMNTIKVIGEQAAQHPRHIRIER